MSYAALEGRGSFSMEFPLAKLVQKAVFHPVLVYLFAKLVHPESIRMNLDSLHAVTARLAQPRAKKVKRIVQDVHGASILALKGNQSAPFVQKAVSQLMKELKTVNHATLELKAMTFLLHAFALKVTLVR